MIVIGYWLIYESNTLYPGDRLSRPWLDLERLHLRFTQPIARYGSRSSAALSRPISSPASGILGAICRLADIDVSYFASFYLNKTNYRYFRQPALI
jgi:hypothetical protein